ncbi:MAG: YbjN domain-containing protein [Planktomarina sp.]
MKALSTFLTASVLAATSASAEQIKASDPDGLTNFLVAEGIDAKLGEDDYGDPIIRIKYYGTNFSLYFYGCNEAQNCQSIQFYVGYRTQGSWSDDQATTWNRERRYSKAYVTDKGSSRLEYDVYTGDYGVHPDDFVEMFSTWTRDIEDFEAEISW